MHRSLSTRVIRHFSSSKLQIKQLRELTGAPLLKCKEAIEQFKGDLNAAKMFLFEKNLASAEKKADRETACGMLVLSSRPSSYLGFAEIACETDFVLKNENFLDFGEKVRSILPSLADSVDMDKQQTEDFLKAHQPDLWGENQQLIAKIQENIRVNSIFLEKLPAKSNLVFGNYMHSTLRANLGKSLTYVALSHGKGDALTEREEKYLGDIAEEIAVHVFCKKPDYVRKEEMPEEELSQIEQTVRDSLDENFGKKPLEIQEKIMSGKLSKLLDDRLLMTQEFEAMEDGVTIEMFLKNASSELGFEVQIERFKTVKI